MDFIHVSKWKSSELIEVTRRCLEKVLYNNLIHFMNFVIYYNIKYKIIVKCIHWRTCYVLSSCTFNRMQYLFYFTMMKVRKVPPGSHCFLLARWLCLPACVHWHMRSARVSMLLFTDVAWLGLCVDGLGS